MSFNSLHFVPKPFGASACAGKAVVRAAFVFLIASSALGQKSQFAFDARGNLLARKAESIALPQILSQPQPQVVAPGALASFFVVVANSWNLTYQWRFNGTNISGATSDALLVPNVSAANVGEYSVVLGNSSGSVTSAPAALMLDGDRDGLPDSWEQTYFGGLSQKPTGDFDGDDVSNRDEFQQDTNPADSASVRFELTLISDGGHVALSPSRFSFTNGEVVTLTATAFAPNTFHGWTGATNTTSNPVSLTMTNNQTVFAHLGSYDITWTNAGSGDWNLAANWTPNFVPGTNDNVFIAGGTVNFNGPGAVAMAGLNLSGGTVNFNGPVTPAALNLSGGTLGGTNLVTVGSVMNWTGGTMSGSGRTILAAGSTLNLASASSVNLVGRTLENGGTVLWMAGGIGLNGAVITNRAGALFELRGVGALAYIGGDSSRFDNAGTFRKSVNVGTTICNSSTAFNNFNLVEIQTGTLTLAGGGTHSSSFDLSAGTTLNLSGGTFTATGDSSIAGAGSLAVSSGTANLNGNISTNNTLAISFGTANFNGPGAVAPAVLNMSGGTLDGSQMVTVGSVLNWSGGTMSGSGRTIIPTGATLNVASAGSVNLLNRTLENGGTTLWTSGAIGLLGAVITNRVGGLFETRGAGSLLFLGGSSRFDNAGTFRKSVHTGTTSLGSIAGFNNSGTVEIRSGIVAGSLGYTSTANSLFHCALGGTNVGTGYGRLQVSAAVALNGALRVDFTNGFLPSVNDTFTVLTANSRSGTFGSFFYPSNLVTMQLSNTANSVIVRVTEVLVVPPPVLLPPELAGSDIRLTWTTVSNIAYRLEFNSDLNPSNWLALPGDVVGVSNTASKVDALTVSNRYYRVRANP